VRGLSYPGSVVLDFFAGSGVTTRVAIEEGRHSISSDLSSKLPEYVEKQISFGTIEKNGLFESPIAFKILPEDSFNAHPVFNETSTPPLKAEAEVAEPEPI
jgi:site-specific DNA-methyltransferase (adenine-specific)